MTQTSSRNIVIVVIAAFLLLGAGLYILYSLYQQNHTQLVSDQNSTTDQQTTAAGLPERLSIPSIGIDAPVIQVGLDKNGDVGTPSGPSQVAWYKLGPRPGQTGSAVITGHFGPWLDGSHSVFDNLQNIKTGDKIYVKTGDGTTLTFQVTGQKTYHPDDKATEVFNSSSGVHLNLITCHGDWLANQKTYTQRLVIFTNLVS
jgi:sortase A